MLIIDVAVLWPVSDGNNYARRGRAYQRCCGLKGTCGYRCVLLPPFAIPCHLGMISVWAGIFTRPPHTTSPIFSLINLPARLTSRRPWLLAPSTCLVSVYQMKIATGNSFRGSGRHSVFQVFIWLARGTLWIPDLWLMHLWTQWEKLGLTLRDVSLSSTNQLFDLIGGEVF